jgi:hypothetical protein
MRPRAFSLAELLVVIGNVRGTLLCPETSERGMPSGPDQNLGAASKAWWTRRGDYLGSYGLNYWIFVPAPAIRWPSMLCSSMVTPSTCPWRSCGS